jgi:predicted Zn finger-like uncharacterized protein
MSLATRCPACGTIFRVVQDQLKVSEGWVRCGQCQEVFHGIEALFDLDNDPVVAARRAATQSAAMPTPARVFAEPRANETFADASSTSNDADDGGFAPVPQAPRSAFESWFAPTSIEPPPALASPAPAAPTILRPTIAPRFAARLAEDSARALAPPAPAAPQPAPTPMAGIPDWQGLVPDTPQPFGSAPTPISESEPANRAAPFVPDLADPPSPPGIAALHVDDSPGGPAPVPEPVPVPIPVPVPAPAPEIAYEPEFGGSTVPSMLAQDDVDEALAGPPTLASMLPQGPGQWPPRRSNRRKPGAAVRSELAIVDRSRDPRFLREARRGARWRRPWVRASLVLALVLLVVAAAGQVAWPQRDLLAARWPATLPAWNWLCAQAGCRLAAPLSIASLSLDGSTLTRTDADHVLLFSADLHNRGDHAVAVPSFDVTFMDINGAIVARKVLTPAQIGVRQASLPADGELHVHARLQVGTLAANGFQADLFYP